jgi:hypothetical protein
VEKAMHANLITTFAYDTSLLTVTELASSLCSLISLSDEETRGYECCTCILQWVLLLPSLSVSMQHVDFGLPKSGRVPYFVLLKPRKASPFTLYAPSHPTWIIKPTHNMSGPVVICSHESGSEDDP